MENTTGDSNKPSKRVDNHTRKDKPSAYSSTGCSKQYNVNKHHMHKMLEYRFVEECPYPGLILEPFCSWREKVVAVLNVVRRREKTEENPKTGLCRPTRFCECYNIAFFDFDKECEYVLVLFTILVQNY
ncbi:hypothetical protein SETIT_5G020000v2 [Setaria italica]|uniref:Uncharacterized protein n=1 Tax=Setaria italica TaxID=4555 RepID=A0A368R0B4_SETIT|nr:hypothetical protein SETIT_5G020000v2 [Setaria italica]